MTKAETLNAEVDYAQAADAAQGQPPQYPGGLEDRVGLLEAVFNSVNDGVIVVDAAARILLFNAAAKRMSRDAKVELKTGKWHQDVRFLMPDRETPVSAAQNPILLALRGRTTDNMVTFVRNEGFPDGIYLSVTAWPLRGRPGGSVGGAVVIFFDVTDRVRNEQRLQKALAELRDQNRLMQEIFSSVSDGLVVTDEQGEFLFINPAAKSIAGMGATDAPPDEWSETYGTFYPDGKAVFPSRELPLARAMRGETVSNVELLIRNRERPEGVHINVDARPLKDDAGALKGGVIAFRDVTQSRKQEAELRETVRRLEDQTRQTRAVLRDIGEGVVVTDARGRVQVASASAALILGGAPAGARSSEPAGAVEFFLDDKGTPVPAGELPVERALRGKVTNDMALFVRGPDKPDGAFISVIATPLRDDSDAVQGAVSFFRDITELKQTQGRLTAALEDLRAQAQTMETVFDSMSDGVIVADANNKLLMANRGAYRITGMSEDSGRWLETTGFFFPDRTTPYPISELPLPRAIRGEATDGVELFLRNQEVPQGIFLSVSGRPLRDSSGALQGGVIVFRDITERAQADEALTEAFSQGRLEIVDTILHNIGNAINSVSIGVGTVRERLAESELVARLSALADAVRAHRDDLAEYLQADPQGQKVAPFILALAEDLAAQDAELNRVIGRVDSRVKHIVDVIRTQKSFDSASMARTDINLRRSINSAVGMMQESLAKRGVEVVVDCRNAPTAIRTQESKFNQMLINILKNAMEAISERPAVGMPEVGGQISVRAYTRTGFLVLDVTDNGTGIKEEHSRQIFAAGFTTRKRGSGLGLHSAANFVAGSGGRISPVSAGWGRGTTMRVELRLSTLHPQFENRGGGGNPWEYPVQ